MLYHKKEKKSTQNRSINKGIRTLEIEKGWELTWRTVSWRECCKNNHISPGLDAPPSIDLPASSSLSSTPFFPLQQITTLECKLSSAPNQHSFTLSAITVLFLSLVFFSFLFFSFLAHFFFHMKVGFHLLSSLGWFLTCRPNISSFRVIWSIMLRDRPYPSHTMPN